MLVARSCVNQIGVTHPIIYDTYNLCEFNKQNHLNVFKIVMLKEICSTFVKTYMNNEKLWYMHSTIAVLKNQHFAVINDVLPFICLISPYNACP